MLCFFFFLKRSQVAFNCKRPVLTPHYRVRACVCACHSSPATLFLESEQLRAHGLARQVPEPIRAVVMCRAVLQEGDRVHPWGQSQHVGGQEAKRSARTDQEVPHSHEKADPPV